MEFIKIVATPLCVSLIITLIFIHCHFKKYEFLSKINDYLLFKKNFFNKKHYFPVENKTVISFFFLTGMDIVLFIMTCHVNIIHIGSILFDNILSIFIFLFIIEIIIRLIYEFLIIPHLYKKQVYQSQVQDISTQLYMQNTQFTQQPVHDMQQQSVNNANIMNNQTIFASEEQSFKFCSQCGTRYDATKNTCPNCGLK